MSKYIDAKQLKTEIERQRDSALERQKSLEKIGQETLLNEMIAFELNKILSFIDSLQKEAEEERLKAYKQEQETSIMYRDAVIQRIERKRVLPSFKGELFHSFKNELNTMEQILSIRNWSDTQYALFEKFALVFAAWGGYHFHPKETESEDSLQQ